MPDNSIQMRTLAIQLLKNASKKFPLLMTSLETQKNGQNTMRLDASDRWVEDFLEASLETFPVEWASIWKTSLADYSVKAGPIGDGEEVT